MCTFITSAAGGLFKFTKVIPGNFAASVIGSLLMGYGALLAFGCNIGAYFSGIASFSLHGYIWGMLALAGTFLTLYLRHYLDCLFLSQPILFVNCS